MWDSYDGSAKKSFFVCQSGITSSTAISSFDSFALAGVDNNIYLFSFLTGTTIQQFYAHDDTITAICFKKVGTLYLKVLMSLPGQIDFNFNRPND